MRHGGGYFWLSFRNNKRFVNISCNNWLVFSAVWQVKLPCWIYIIFRFTPISVGHRNFLIIFHQWLQLTATAFGAFVFEEMRSSNSTGLKLTTNGKFLCMRMLSIPKFIYERSVTHLKKCSSSIERIFFKKINVRFLILPL